MEKFNKLFFQCIYKGDEVHLDARRDILAMTPARTAVKG
jgi:hypothetical protein